MTDPEQLILGWLDGALSEPERSELTDWLKADAEHLRRFTDAVLFEQQIRSVVSAREQQAAFGGVESPLGAGRNAPNLVQQSSNQATGFGIAGVLWGATIVCTAVVALFAFRWLGEDEKPLPNVPDSKVASPANRLPNSNEGSFCRLVRTASVQWGEGKAFQSGARLGAGRVKLVAGTAEFRLDNGVRAICTGPAELEFLDLMHAWLHHGEVVFRVPHAAIGFQLETSDAVIVDLGTEFGVRVDEPTSGDRDEIADKKNLVRNTFGTELQVYEGEVIADAKTGSLEVADSKRRVQGGQAMRIGNGYDGFVQELPFHPERFVHEMPDPKDHPEAAGSKFPKTSPYNKAEHEAIRIVPAPKGIAIDGSLSDWDLRGRFSSACPPPWREFYNVQGALMYDDRFLYIGAKVADPYPMRSAVSPTPDRELYGGGGSVVLKISTDRKMGWPAVAKRRSFSPKQPAYLPEDLNERLATLVMWYYAAESQPCLDVRYGIDHHGRRLNPSGYRGAWKMNSNGLGYTMEYAIPWSLLNAAEDPPRAGDTLACTWLVHWSDATGRNWRGQLIEIVNPKETGWNFQNAGTWGRALFEAAESAK
jgi:hypothetical protein